MILEMSANFNFFGLNNEENCKHSMRRIVSPMSYIVHVKHKRLSYRLFFVLVSFVNKTSRTH